MKHSDMIYLLPNGEQNSYTWCDDPAPGIYDDPGDATAYIKASIHDDLIKQRDALFVALKNYHASQCGEKKICGHDFCCTCQSDLAKETIAAVEGE